MLKFAERLHHDDSYHNVITYNRLKKLIEHENYHLFGNHISIGNKIVINDGSFNVMIRKGTKEKLHPNGLYHKIDSRRCKIIYTVIDINKHFPTNISHHDTTCPLNNIKALDEFGDIFYVSDAMCTRIDFN